VALEGSRREAWQEAETDIFNWIKTLEKYPPTGSKVENVHVCLVGDSITIVGRGAAGKKLCKGERSCQVPVR
jgi:hypothetical protein